jgi:hypothetical protein
MHTYDMSGFSCTEGPMTFSNFVFTDSGTVNPLPTDSAVDVSPIADGMEFRSTLLAPSGTDLDVSIGYVIHIQPGVFTADSLSIAGFGQSGNGSLDVSESVCVGAAFNSAGACPTGVVKSLNTFDNSSGLKQSDSVTFAPATVLGVRKDGAFSGGSGASSAQLSLIDNVTPHEAVVPEPITSLLAGASLLAMGFVGRKRRI